MKLTAEWLRENTKYDPETGEFWWKIRGRGRKLDAQLGTINGSGYRQIRLLGRLYMAHRLAWLYVHAEWPDSILDHINRVKSDNRISNLRLSNHSENGLNQGFGKGVYYDKRRDYWRAYVCLRGKYIELGRFPTRSQAHDCRERWNEARTK